MPQNPHLQDLADEIDRAEKHRRPIPTLSERFPELTYADALAVQSFNVERRRAEGARLVGYKVGLTGLKAQAHFGVYQPDMGHLYDRMAVSDQGEVNLGELIHPRIEGEIAFVLGGDLAGPGLTLVDITKAIDYVTVAMEIIDARYSSQKFKITDLVADNGFSSRFVLGSAKRRLEEVDLPSLGMALYQNGEVFSTGSGAAVMGNPLSSLTFLANELGKRGKSMKAGEVVLSGAITDLVSVQAGDFYRCDLLYLGSVSVRFRGGN